MGVIKRLTGKTPKFFRTLRTIGLVFTGVSATILTGGVALPAVVGTIAGYMGVAGAVAATVSQLTIPKEKEEIEESK